MKILSVTTFLIWFLMFPGKGFTQSKEVSFYRQEIGVYFLFSKKVKREKIAFKEGWDFYFSLKNDSVAVIQDIKNRKVQTPREYKISSLTDSAYVKHYGGGKPYKELMYFRKLYLQASR